MNLGSLDLNLLVALNALLEERGVTRAAARLGVTQPTMSHALARLRRHFNDELLHRSGNTYDLTPLAVHLAGRSAVVMDGVRRVFAVQQAPEPALSTRQFTFLCSDYGAAVAGPALSVALAQQAPRTTLHFTYSDPNVFTARDDGLRAVDGLLMPHGFLPESMPHLDLHTDGWVCLVAADNTMVGAALTMADLSRLPWASTFTNSVPGTTALRQLQQLGVAVRVEVIVNGFLPLPFFLAGTDRISLVPRRVAELLTAAGGLRTLECPFDAVPLVEALWWHPDFERDAEHAWLRKLWQAELAEEAPRQKEP